MNGPQSAMLPDGKRLHLNHGPIDLIVQGFGNEAEIAAAYRQAEARFATVLGGLVEELGALRRRASAIPRAFVGPVARRMDAAVCRLSERFITPMAAVAGSVADEVLEAMVAGLALDRAYVNNGGDIAIYLAPGRAINAAIAGTGHGLSDRVTIHAADPVRGIATSGWRGRSHSLGIADAVTILAETAAMADAAATLIANAINLPGHPNVQRTPANELAPDSDLGSRLVTTGVGGLTARETDQALENGVHLAQDFVRRGLIVSAALFLNGESRLAGRLALTHHSSRKKEIHA